MTFIPNPVPADGSVTTAKLGGDVTTAAKDLLKATTKAAQREELELPNLMTQVDL